MVEHEQRGKNRAGYGEQLIESLAVVKRWRDTRHYREGNLLLAAETINGAVTPDLDFIHFRSLKI